MPASDIVIKGAREHNLRDVSLVLPRNQLICLTGVSGSGKSSLAFDTLFAEGQRRYVESLSTFARQYVGQMPKPEVDYISGLSPSISISQKSAGNNPRSTVGTITEIHDFLRVLYARVGAGHCPKCDRKIAAQSREQIIARILHLPRDTKILVLAPLVRGQKGEHRDLFEHLLKEGFARARVDGEVVSLSTRLSLDRQIRHDIEVVVDRLTIEPGVRTRLAEAVELALKMGRGNLFVSHETSGSPAAGDADLEKQLRLTTNTTFSADYACTHCGVSFEPPSPQLFSFNSPRGMCEECDGMGNLYSFAPELLIPNDRLSFRKGCIELLGKWKEMGRWRRHIYHGVADTMERKLGLDEGVMLETPWCDLEESVRNIWLWGAGDEHITFTWRGGASPMKYGGEFEGVIPNLLGKHRESNSRIQRRRLEKYMSTVCCPRCRGTRLNAQARSVRLTTLSEKFDSTLHPQGRELSLPEIAELPIIEAAEFFSALELDDTRTIIAAEALKEIRNRLGFLVNVGLDYLSLSRTAPTLSGGESQRIRLASQIGAALVGVLYVLDEPSIGLHPRDNDRLLGTLQQLRDMGNTVVVVEHDEDTMRAADHIFDFGPGPGVRGGELVAEGGLEAITSSKRSVTGQYLSGKLKIAIPATRRPTDGDQLSVLGARHNNLKNVDVHIPLGALVCVTGVSGSGKSSLVNDILIESLRRDLNGGEGEPGAHDTIEGWRHLDKLIAIDQSPIGRTPRSNPGTYIKVFDEIRNLFAQLPDAKRRGYKPGRFSFNVAAGRCEACDGNGSNRLEMDFLADVWVTCPVCQGKRFNRETLQVKFKGRSIADVLELDVQQALELFDAIPKIRHKLQTLHDVGLDYLKIGQPSPTLSGGEAQRIKLARELAKKSTGHTLYLLDEPTTGLHFADINMLLQVLHGFADAGNTVLVVEHNLDVIKTADWIIDLGPEGGAGGGRIVVEGTPENVARCKESHTGAALAKVLNGKATIKRTKKGAAKKRGAAKRNEQIIVRGAHEHNLKHVDVVLQRDKLTAFCGMSGSGKSSLAMDTIYAEGQRRYVESLSSYARQFVSQMQKPRLDHIEGLSPAIAIEQKNLGHSPRSTVGTVTEVYDYLRILLARLGQPYCPECDVPIGSQTSDEIIAKIMLEPEGSKLYLMAPMSIEVGQKYETLWEEAKAAGFARVRVDGLTYSLDEPPKITRRRKHQVEVVVDRATVRPGARSRIADSVEASLTFGRGQMTVARVDSSVPEPRWETVSHSLHRACDQCGRSFEPLSPHNFSFNSQLGWCADCEGLGVQTGANLSALLNDPKLTLAEGALALWPDLNQDISRWMLESLSTGASVPLDVPFEQLGARQRRTMLHGAGDQWFAVRGPASKKKDPPLFRFQFKGLYPALEEAARISPTLRARLEHLVDEVECASCGGTRLRDDSSAVRFHGKTLDEICRLPLAQLQEELAGWKLDQREKRVAGEVIREIRDRIRFLNDVGLHYLSLSRTAASLSNGEAQRIRLASQLGSGLCGVLYVLDEPTIGLHPRDNRRLLNALLKLRDLGNTLLVVEHDREVLENADAICDFGPAAGKNGGNIVAQGTPAQLAKMRGSITGPYLSGKKAIPVFDQRRVVMPPPKPKSKKSLSTKKKPVKKKKPAGSPQTRPQAPGGWLEVLGARHHNLRNVHLQIPLGALTAVTGPSGSGKSSLIEGVLYNSLARTLHRASTTPGPHDEIIGLENINKVIRVNQRPLGNTPTSNPATYTGAFELIRILFAQLPEAKIRGYQPRRFSFNAAGGRCDACEGNGQIRIEMHFLPDVWVECETCRGQRYNPDTLAVRYEDRSISDVLNLTCGDAVKLFENIPKIRKILQTLCDVGLDYLTLGQSAPTLSGGEAQRVKLAAELSRPDTGRTLYLLDEPTTGLHFEDLAKLLDVLHRLVDLGNSVVVIEHNLDVIKSADWVVDLGPEAGEEGGQIVAQGTPEALVDYARKAKRSKKLARSHTGEALAPVLAESPRKVREPFDPHKEHAQKPGDLDIIDVGRFAKMPWEQDGRRWHTQDRVGRRGEPCQWDGRLLERVVDFIHEKGELAETDWNSRSVVEIAAEKKILGWFFHAITGEAWLLKMKFRAARNAFKRGEVAQMLPLRSLNEMDEIPLYGNDPRVRQKMQKGPWQEIEIRAHSLQELDRPEFWSLLERAVESFMGVVNRAVLNPHDLMPWKALGKKWHLLRKGFPPGKRVLWEVEVLERLCDIVETALPSGSFQWDNKVLVHHSPPGADAPWASIHTKRPAVVELVLRSPKDRVALGRIAHLARDRSLDATHEDRDIVKLRFRTLEDLERGDLANFLKEQAGSLEA